MAPPGAAIAEPRTPPTTAPAGPATQPPMTRPIAPPPAIPPAPPATVPTAAPAPIFAIVTLSPGQRDRATWEERRMSVRSRLGVSRRNARRVGSRSGWRTSLVLCCPTPPLGWTTIPAAPMLSIPSGRCTATLAMRGSAVRRRSELGLVSLLVTKSPDCRCCHRPSGSKRHRRRASYSSSECSTRSRPCTPQPPSGWTRSPDCMWRRNPTLPVIGTGSTWNSEPP
mmetsp:Transcript_14485/g.34046  ORF Transcript_14485/g.34046 Transcript_14485/m.34046 type:complete len:225 (-) Transcript_14485:48-722(-)